ncbi:MAG: hypothetical protein L0Z53_00250 [Acidobacteriales bacterium]|nr:hypothetical protein [Terriglobales bacterium]MCI0421624.1 hypothetical protein [Acidobacteriota bacterium]MCI0620218.1 hypothetical protein [Acidobacteriota bacterium]MCI0722852.1 hypothetical protein [Acidobacteriota bacterium]
MTCQNVRENFWGYQRRELVDDVALSISSHLQTCQACAAEFEHLRQVDGVLDGFAAIEPSTYFDQKLNARLNAVERTPSGWAWIAVWLKDRYLWTFAALFLAATGLWLGFRHQQNKQLRSMEEVVQIQDENLRPRPATDAGAKAAATANPLPASARGNTQPAVEEEHTIPEEDLAVVENFELLQDYDFLKDLAGDTAHGAKVKTN